MLEREVKLAVPPAFALPDLEDLAAAVETSPIDERRLETVYYDTPDLRLARWGANLRIRQGEGWTLKLPSTSEGPALTRRELEFPGDASQPPDAAVALEHLARWLSGDRRARRQLQRPTLAGTMPQRDAPAGQA